MHPILYEYTFLGQQRLVAGYGLMVALGVLVGLGMVIALAHRRRLDIINTVLVALIAIGAGLLGSYLLFLITIIPDAIENPAALLTGGLVFYGGPLAAVPAGVIAARRMGIAPLKMVDVAAPALALGHACGRMGCFLGGCCFGCATTSPLSVVFTHPLAPAAHPAIARHPVQMYEALFLLTAAVIMLTLWRRTRGDGRQALGYLLAYTVWRFVIEIFRDDVVRGFVIPGWITTSQAISIGLVPLAVLGLVWLGRRARPDSLLGRIESPSGGNR